MILDRTLGLEALLRQVEGNAEAMVALARVLWPENRATAVQLCSRALDLAPANGEVRVIAAEVLSAGVPTWHFDIVRDHARNDAYEAALRRAIFPGCKVLEIGAGTGLLAMMAARAGAGSVITCEADAAVALAAQRVITHNGFADRVKVVAKHSTALDVDADLGGPADILVSEIIANDLVGEDALPALEHACRHLLKPGGLMIPARGRVRVALAFDEDLDDARMGHVAGFDLSPFNRIASPHHELYVGAPRINLRSAPADLFAFDFASGGPFPPGASEVALSAAGGRINGVVQWIALELDDVVRYENAPEPGTSSSWMAVFYPFGREIDGAPGHRVVVHARHDRGGLRLWSD